jgi:hypothetical protein
MPTTHQPARLLGFMFSFFAYLLTNPQDHPLYIAMEVLQGALCQKF